MSITQVDDSESFGSIVRAGISILRSRLSFFLVGVAVLSIPMMTMSLVSTSLQWGYVSRIWWHLGDPAWIADHAPRGTARLLQWASYPVSIAGFSTVQAFLSRAGLDVLRGAPDTLLGTLRRCVRAILWLALMDTVLVVVVYIGCICCVLPGLVGFLAVSAWLSFQTIILCDDPTANWFEAARRSRAMSLGREGNTIGIACAYFGTVLSVSTVILVIAAAVFYVSNGGFDTTTPGFSRNTAIAYIVANLVSWVPGMAAWSAWALMRVAFYHRITTGHRMRTETAEVFS